MFLKSKMFRASPNAVQSTPPTRNPFVTRRLTSLNHGRVDEFSGSMALPSSPNPPGVVPSAAGNTRVYGSPLANRHVTKAPTLRSTVPSVVTFIQSVGKLNDPDPTM